MNKAVLAGIIAGIIIVGLAIGYSMGVENQDEVNIEEQVNGVQEPRNITIELSDGMSFSATP